MANTANDGTGSFLSGLITRQNGKTNPYQIVYERTARLQPFNLAPLQDPRRPTSGQIWPRGDRTPRGD
jgi:hypothetical protein